MRPAAYRQGVILLIWPYKILNKLGAGGMGEVYLAEDTELDRKVALKFLMTRCTADAEVKSRFEREAKAAAALNHPNIITVYEIGEYEGRAYIAMEYVEGESLRQKVSSGQLSVESAVDIAMQTCDGSNAAHQAGIIHRDIKPENIIIDKSGRVRILDFGLARMAGVSKLTKEASTLGTISYMSPEQFQGALVDQRADVWAVGVVLYEMLTGELPFQGDYEQAVMYSVLNEKPEPIADLRPDLPATVETVIFKALEKDQNKRYQNMQELLLDLQALTVSPTAAPKQEKSIVVLPFENMSPDPEQEYFSDGLTEEIITDLSQIHDLLVISRSSAMTFKGSKKKIREIAKEVNVRYVLEGGVRKAGNNLRITAQLIDATTNAHLWAEKYKGTLDDVFEIQEKVSRCIVESLKVTLSQKESKKIAERQIDNVQAYECWLKARQEIYQWTEDNLVQALNYLEKGLEIIGENSALYAGMGFVYFQFHNSGIRTDEETLRKAESYIDKVFQLEPDAVLGHFVMGVIRYIQGKIKEAIRHLTHTITLDPNHSDSMRILSYIYSMMIGNSNRARPLSQKALEIDPLMPVNYLAHAFSNWAEGRYDLALESCKKYYQMAPKNIHAQQSYVTSLLWIERFDEAFTLIDILQKEHPSHIFTNMLVMFKYALQNKKTDALQSVTEEQRNAAWNHSYLTWIMAECYALMNEKDESLDWLENAVNKGWCNYPLFSKLDPFLQNIRSEERFKKLMGRVRYEWEHFEV
ncbi:MAG: protein kinase [bacterium]